VVTRSLYHSPFSTGQGKKMEKLMGQDKDGEITLQLLTGKEDFTWGILI